MVEFILSMWKTLDPSTKETKTQTNNSEAWWYTLTALGQKQAEAGGSCLRPTWALSKQRQKQKNTTTKKIQKPIKKKTLLSLFKLAHLADIFSKINRVSLCLQGKQ